MESGDLDSDIEERKSKSQIKREFVSLRALGVELIELSKPDLYKVPLTEDLYKAVLDAKKFKREALRRQILHIAKLLHAQDIQAIHKAIEEISRPHKKEVKVLHEVEQWRDSLISGDDKLLNEIVNQYSIADRQYLRQLVRNAIKERENNKPPSSARVLYQYLLDLRSENN